MSVRRRSPTATWLLLVMATAVMTWMLPTVGGRFAAVVTMIIAAWKVRLIILDFMELRDAPLPARCVFEGWAIGAPGLILALYLAG